MSWTQNGRLYDRYIGIDGKSHRISVPLAKNTPQARRRAERELSEKISTELSLTGKKSLSEALSEYFEHKDVKLTTLVNEKNALRQVLLILGDVPVITLTAPIIKRRLIESKKPTSTLNRYLALFNAFLKWCFEFGYIENPLKVSAFPQKTTKKDDGSLYLERDELKKVLDALDGTMDGYVCRFMALTGCRIGEAAALTLSDLDEHVHITKTKTYLGNIQAPKTVHSERDIFIQPELRAMLREYYQWRQLYMMAHGIRTDRLFFSQSGNLYSDDWLRVKLHRIDRKLHPHIFRHTHVALLAEQGIPLETISKRLGHSDTKVTSKIYYHVTEKMKAHEEDLLSKVSIL